MTSGSSGLSGLIRRWLMRIGMVVVLAWLVLAGLAPAVPVAADTGPIGMVADDDGYVHVFDAGTNTVLGTVAIPFNDQDAYAIGDCCVSLDGSLGFVTNGQNQLWVIDLTQSPPALASGTNPITISNLGEDIAMTSDGRYLVVVDGSKVDPISAVSIAARTEVDTKSVGSDHNSVDVLSDGSVLVTSWETQTVYRLTIDSAGNLTDTGETLLVGSPYNIYGAPDARSGFVVKHEAENIQTFTVPGLTAVNTRSLPGGGVCGVMHPAGDKIYIRTESGDVLAYSFNSATGALGADPLFTIGAASPISFFGMEQMAITPDGSRLYMPEGNFLKVYDAGTGTELDTISDPNFGNLTGICLRNAYMLQAPGTSQWGIVILVVLLGGAMVWVNTKSSRQHII